jgi:hypothetical protein
MASPATCDIPATSRPRRTVPKGYILLPWVLALFFGVLGMRGISPNLYSDAPNHLMNGALIADWIRSGQLARPIDFAFDYYGRFPAITIPFHPPVFPAIEGLFFLVFGANVLVARILIAAMVALSVVLLSRLATFTLGSALAALCAAAAFFAMRYSTYLASNVMLEMPALLFALAALYQLRGLDESFTLRRAVAYGLLASIALWTKQQAVFLGLVPFIYIAISRRWRLLIQKEVWISAALFGSAVLAFSTLTGAFSGAGGAHEIPKQAYIARTFLWRAMYYFHGFAQTFGVVGSFWIALSCAYALWQPATKRRNIGMDLHLAWACSAFAVLFLTGHNDLRYLFFAYAPLVVLGFATLNWACEWALPANWVWPVPAGIAAACVAAIPWQPATPHMQGPAEAAAAIMDGAPHRVLYCGTVGTGSFIFAARSLDPKLQTTVIRADSLGAKLSAAQVDELAHRYAIDTIVVPDSNQSSQPCDALHSDVPPAMLLKSEIPLNSSDANLVGKFKIYRFTNLSLNPEKRLKINVRKLRRQVEVEF